MAARRVLTSHTFSTLELTLPASNFCRVHKSYLVALNKIEQIERHRIKIKNTSIPISDTYKDHFYTQIGFGSDGKNKDLL